MASARHGLSELTLDIDLTSSAASNTTLMILLDVGVEFAKEKQDGNGEFIERHGP